MRRMIQKSRNVCILILHGTADQFYDHIMQNLVKTGKYTEMNKQSYVKF